MYKRRNDNNCEAEEDSSSSSSSAGSSSYLTLPNVTTDNEDETVGDKELVMAYKLGGGAKKMAQQGNALSSSAMKNNAGSTATLELGLISESNPSPLSGHVSTTPATLTMSEGGNSAAGSSRASSPSPSSASSASSAGEDEKSDADDDSDVSMADSCDGCGDITLVHDKSALPPQNEAEVMFMQIVEMLKFEKKVNHIARNRNKNRGLGKGLGEEVQSC